MTFTEEARQTVTQKSVLHCDGIGCNEVVIQEEGDTHVPLGWLELDQRNRLYGIELRKPHPGILAIPVHFHNWNCLVGWLLQHQTNPPIQTVGD